MVVINGEDVSCPVVVDASLKIQCEMSSAYGIKLLVCFGYLSVNAWVGCCLLLLIDIYFSPRSVDDFSGLGDVSAPSDCF